VAGAVIEAGRLIMRAPNELMHLCYEYSGSTGAASTIHGA
jgi:hypothetical protein